MAADSSRLERVPVRRLRAGLATYLRSVHRDRNVVVVTHRGREAAVLAPVSVLALMDHAAQQMPTVADIAAGMVGPEAAAEGAADPREGGPLMVAKTSQPRIECRRVADLRPAPYNPRTISEPALAGLEASVRRFGLVQPIILNERTGHIVGGHQRLKVLLADGLEETDVVVVDLPEEEEKALNVALNSPQISGEWTADALGLLSEVAGTLPELAEALRLGELRGDLEKLFPPEPTEVVEDECPDGRCVCVGCPLEVRQAMSPADRPLCIYCAERPTGSREDLLPRALGTFPRTHEWRRRDVLCGECNHRYTGELYDRLFRRGPYSIDRALLPIGVGRSREGKKRSSGPSYDYPLADLPGWEGPALVELKQGGVGGGPVRQLLLRVPGKAPFPWRIPEDVLRGETPLAEGLTRAGHAGAKPLRFVDDDNGTVGALIAGAYGSLGTTVTAWTEVGDVLNAGRGWMIHPIHVRGITLLSFHLFLALSEKRGADPGLAAVREVVRGERDPYQVTCNWLPLNPDEPALPIRDERPSVPKHIYTVHVNERGDVVAHLRLFAHRPEAQSPWWVTRLGRADLPPTALCRLALCYFDEPQERDGRRIVGEDVALRHDGTSLIVPA